MKEECISESKIYLSMKKEFTLQVKIALKSHGRSPNKQNNLTDDMPYRQ